MNVSAAGPSAELRALFAPRSVALIGASADPQSISARPLRMLRQHGFGGTLYPVNPKYADAQLEGLKVYPSIAAVPEAVDLALIAVPANVVTPVLQDCAAAGVHTTLVITSGFAESGQNGAALQREITDVVKRSGIRVCGPNSEGLYVPSSGLCATFSPAVDPEHGYAPSRAGGPIAIVSQSGGMAFALLNHAHDRGLDVGAVVSTGNEVDLTWPEYVDYLLDQAEVRVVLGFVEAIRQPARLIAVARKAARLKKPIVVAKIGRSEAGKRAAASHTASLVGADMAHSAAFRQLGILRVDDVDEMLDLAAYFSAARLPAGKRGAVLTASGGAGAWLADACAVRGLELPPPPPETQAAIRELIPAYGSVANPVDITAQAVLGGGYEQALDLLARSDGFDMVVAVATLVREERFFETLPDVKAVIARTSSVVAYYSYTRASPRVIGTLAELGIPCFSTPGRTARALGAAADYASFVRRAGDVAVFDVAASGSEKWPPPVGRLSENGTRAYLAPLGIPSPLDCLARSAADAVACFEALGSQPVALKVQSPDVMHKGAIGGVRLGVSTPEGVREAFAQVMASAAGPVEGVLVQRMAPRGVEAFVAARREPLLGPMVVVGLGGSEVETLRVISMRLAPVSLREAQAMIGELRGAALLDSRGDIAGLAAAVVRVSELAARLPPSVANVEINPLLVLPPGQGVLMLDAALELDRGGGDGSA